MNSKTAAKTIVVVDTETTGLGHRAGRPDGVVQAGYAWRMENGEVKRWHKTCNPGAKFIAGGRADIALRINGLTEQEILAAPSAEAVSAELHEHLEAIGVASGGPVEIRAFNRDFDEPFLRATPWKVTGRPWGPCIMMAAAQHLDGPDGRWPKLPDAVRRLGLPWPDGNAHNAAVDSHAALLVDEVVSGRTKSKRKQ